MQQDIKNSRNFIRKSLKNKKSITCKEVCDKIPTFLSDELWGDEAKDFLSHLESCPECMEEMNIQYLIKEGVLRLEEGRSFDLSGELNGKINICQKDINLRRKCNFLLYILEGFSFVAILFLLFLVILYK